MEATITFTTTTKRSNGVPVRSKKTLTVDDVTVEDVESTEMVEVEPEWLPDDGMFGCDDDVASASVPRDVIETHVEVVAIDDGTRYTLRQTDTGFVNVSSCDQSDFVDQNERGEWNAVARSNVSHGVIRSWEHVEVVTDGGHSDGDLVTVEDDPPVIQRNSKIVNPFEILVRAVNQPKYSEFDPTIALFLTFPLFFGFMIGDVGYGLLYVLIGYAVYQKFDTEALSNFGAVVVWMGLWTILFGFLYGEILGLHFLEWFDIHPVIEKGISDREWAVTWLLVSVIAGWLHLNLAYLFNFIEEFQVHGSNEAIVEVGSWILMLNGLWVFIFSKLGAGTKPDFLVGATSLLNEGPLGFGFTGFPTILGWIGLALFLGGILILLTGPWYEVVEFLVPLAHTLSYTRLTAVLLAKAGMALAVNLLYFGAYRDEEGFHFMHYTTPDQAHGEVVFGGLSNMGSQMAVGPLQIGIEGAILGIPVYLLGHVVVLAIGGTAAIQAIRLEYFEFFEKFYEGGGKNYEPFGHERTHTTDN